MAYSAPQTLSVEPGLAPAPGVIKTALALLRAGELVVFPTETLYGVAADPAAPGGLDRLFAAKGRPRDKAVALLGTGIDFFLAAGIELDGPALRLARRFWPGPLTLVVDGPEGPIGLRVPDHPVPLHLLRAAGAPLAVTSANRSGQPPARTARQARDALGPSVALILDGGPAPGGRASTVVQLTRGEPRILRDGAIPRRDILAACAP